MTDLNATLSAAQRLAALSPGQTNTLNALVWGKFLTPELPKFKALKTARQAHDAMGTELYQEVLASLPDRKLRSLLKALSKHHPDQADLPVPDVVSVIVDLASGAAEPAKPQPKPTKSKKPAAPDLPDLKALYRQGGTRAVMAVIKPAAVAKLKAAIRDQEIQSEIETPGTKKDDLTRFIQIALKEELGDFGDPLAALPTDA